MYRGWIFFYQDGIGIQRHQGRGRERRDLMDGHDDFPLFDSRPDWDLDHKMCLNGLLWQNKEDHTRRLCFYKSCRVRKEWFVYLLCLETCGSERARGGVFEKQKSNCTLFECSRNGLAMFQGRITLCCRNVANTFRERSNSGQVLFFYFPLTVWVQHDHSQTKLKSATHF